MFDIWNRRYTGSKYKLSSWISKLIEENCEGDSFCDIYAGTGIISYTMLNKMKKIYINDFLYSNEVIYKAFFGSADYDKELISKYCGYFRSLSSRDVDENYIISFHDNIQKGSIDVIGPYYNEAYKSYENMKDFYMRVIYVGETASVYSSIMNGSDVVLYITGGATKKMLHDIGYRKYMTAPADSRASKKGNYLVVQMSDSFSYPDFIEQLENEL